MHYTPYSPDDNSWIGGLITFIIGIIGFSYIIFSIPSTDAKAEPIHTKNSTLIKKIPIIQTLTKLVLK